MVIEPKIAKFDGYRHLAGGPRRHEVSDVCFVFVCGIWCVFDVKPLRALCDAMSEVRTCLIECLCFVFVFVFGM